MKTKMRLCADTDLFQSKANDLNSRANTLMAISCKYIPTIIICSEATRIADRTDIAVHSHRSRICHDTSWSV